MNAIAVPGSAIHRRKAAKSAPRCAITPTTNHTASGTSATAVSRCSHHCPTPDLAEPSPTARPSGERMCGSGMLMPPAADPDRPAADIGGFEIEGVSGVPDEMPKAVAQVIGQRGGPPEQQHEPDPRAEK